VCVDDNDVQYPWKGSRITVYEIKYYIYILGICLFRACVNFITVVVSLFTRPPMTFKRDNIAMNNNRFAIPKLISEKFLFFFFKLISFYFFYRNVNYISLTSHLSCILTLHNVHSFIPCGRCEIVSQYHDLYEISCLQKI